MLGVSFDSVQENRAFARKFDFGFPLLSDPDRRIGMDYHAAADPEQAYANRITYVIGPDGAITHVYPKVDTATHAAEILRALSAGG